MRSWPNVNSEVSHASGTSFAAVVRSRHAMGGKRERCVTRQKWRRRRLHWVLHQCCLFLHTIIQTKAAIDRKRPVPEFISDELKGFLVFFCPPLNDIFVGIFWKVITFFLYWNANVSYLVAHLNPPSKKKKTLACVACLCLHVAWPREPEYLVSINSTKRGLHILFPCMCTCWLASGGGKEATFWPAIITYNFLE